MTIVIIIFFLLFFLLLLLSIIIVIIVGVILRSCREMWRDCLLLALAVELAEKSWQAGLEAIVQKKDVEIR